MRIRPSALSRPIGSSSSCAHRRSPTRPSSAPRSPSGGIRTVEFTFTTPHLPQVLAAAAASRVPGQHDGAGTVVTAEQAEAAIDAGAEFLVTPAIRPQVAAVAQRRGVPVFLGALTPSEVLAALDLGSAAVKIFPASANGPRYLKDLHGPFPDVRLVPSGGVSSANAREFLEYGAFAVSAGTEVVPPSTVAAGDHAEIARRAVHFVSRRCSASRTSNDRRRARRTWRWRTEAADDLRGRAVNFR